MLTTRASCRSLRYIWSDHLREKGGDHVHADSTCTSNEDSLQHHGATAPPDDLSEHIRYTEQERIIMNEA